ncbi:TRAP transporter transmembrane subunit DctQM [Oleiphilus messinensis]|uniref:TRAP transporter transmembrane subunit DctQM n=1 Tax=Oleiphilus messinensis TaxID=141451 RepID=A0A1Y0IC52_9GAMM|nr:TRAP transporter large permease subunit [Oleiphilus messinensis]ARU58108.1 TRAP transporter transmembrane subunit DctQM [Oleiphilus messinensis]
MTVRTEALVAAQGRGLSRWVSGLPMLTILLLTLMASVGETLHSRLLEIGGATWPEYFNLRVLDHVQAPTCNATPDLESAIDKAVKQRQAEMANDPFADVFGGAIDRSEIASSIEAQAAACAAQWQNWEHIQSLDTPAVRAFATFETGLSQGVVLVTGNRRVLLGLMLLFCAAAATLRRQHIALRPVETQRDDLVATVTQLLANGILTFSALLYRQQELAQAEAGMPLAHLFMHDVWVTGFGALTLISAWQLRQTRTDLPAGGRWGRSLLSIPLYSFMCLTAAAQFAWHGFYHGIAVYLNMMAELSALFLSLGLYVWVGMLLARTHLPQKVFALIRPWELPPKWLGVVVLLLTALPTAYSGASGIFILAAGMTLYRELRRAGTSEQLALATTAISGSMGTMLRPCLLVVIVATLNNSVTTDELFAAGARVLLLTAFLYTVYVLFLGGKSTLKVASPRVAIPGMLKALLPLLPYIACFVVVIMAWEFLLGRGLDEFSAPAILPIVMLMILAMERFLLKEHDPEHEAEESAPRGFGPAVMRATDDSTALIGALLMLMALSVSMGGLIERSGLLELFPHDLGSVWLTLALLMGMLVIIGMIMDPYGAVLLVNATLAPIALENGINPLHFWVMTVLAFEMGYLTPPVALNHLLTRQVVGMPTEWESLHGTFWQRNFRYILPVLVMGTALLIVTFTPEASSWAYSFLLGAPAPM